MRNERLSAAGHSFWGHHDGIIAALESIGQSI